MTEKLNPYIKRRATEIVASFLTEGYYVLCDFETFVSLRHRKNGNKIRIYLRENYLLAYKNGNLIIKEDAEPSLFKSEMHQH